MTKTILVTGATGFVAHHLISQALAEGHRVIATTRPGLDEARIAHLKALAGAAERLSFKAWDIGTPLDATGADCIIHLAWPSAPTGRKGARQRLAAASDATLSVLSAARDTVATDCVVLVSAMQTMAAEPGNALLDEARFNRMATLGATPFAFAKIGAEQAAAAFMEKEKPDFRLVILNPAPLTGPAHDGRLPAGNAAIAGLVTGRVPRLAAWTYPFTDVRDLAKSCLAAFATPEAEGRYLCLGAALAMDDLVAMIRRNGYSKAPLPQKGLAGLWRAVAGAPGRLFAAPVETVVWTELPDRGQPFSTARLRGDLGIWFRHREDMVTDALKALAAQGRIPAAGPVEMPKAFSWDETLLGR